MRFLVSVVLVFGFLSTQGQSASSLNISYLYNGQADVQMNMMPVMRGDTVQVYYQLFSERSIGTVTLQWEKRDSYNQRQGIVLMKDSISLTNGPVESSLRFLKLDKPWLLVATVVNLDNGKKWYFFKQIEAHYPVNGFLESNGKKIWKPYISSSEKYTVKGSGTGKDLRFSYYKDNFPTPSPPFADKELKMDRFLFPDSTFTVSANSTIGPFKKEGLYLAQEDTTSAEGFSFLVMNDPYPKYNKLGDLIGPLLFVTTKEENDQISAAGEDKAKFDKVILEITKDKERAKNFMRSYFKRVELANLYFTSFKEGWKTDRGMVYMVFGPPDTAVLNGQQEIWGYKTLGLQFYFTKAGSVYSPDHFVLVRDKDYTEFWYQTIDLWRKSRF